MEKLNQCSKSRKIEMEIENIVYNSRSKEVFNLLENENRFIILDGAMGTMLQNEGLKLGEIPEVLNITASETVTKIHKAYIDAGSDIVYTNTFGCNRKKTEGASYSVEELVKAAVENAKKAVKQSGRDAYVALDIGPIGEMLEPNGTLSFEEAYDIFKEQVDAGAKAGADLVVIETMTDLYEVKAAVLAVKENSNLPVFSTMTFEKNHRTFTGCCPESYASTITGLGADAVGINCSLGPDEIYPIAEKIREYTHLPIIVKANAGLPNPDGKGYNIDKYMYAKGAKKIADLGIKIIGGCCGTNPEYIREIKNILDGLEPEKYTAKKISSVCTPTRFVNIDEVKVVGERINPTGKKRFKQALIDGEINYILSQAIEQVDAGADILDVNVGLPQIDEPEMMKKVVKEIQSITDVPLQLDSSDAAALESGLRIYNGKPIVNSVNGEEKSLERVLPLVKKYGASVIGLTLDENGIPETVQGRIEIAKKILQRAIQYGIPKEDVYIDCLTLTVSAEPKAASKTLEAVSRIKNELGLKTVLGVSNISFGLPEREVVNSRFLTMAMHSGLDLPIINPNSYDMMSSVNAHKLLTSGGGFTEEFIEKYSNVSGSGNSGKKINNGGSGQTSNGENNASGTDMKGKTPEELIINSVVKGMGSDVAKYTEILLEKYDEIEIINRFLIPALDLVGERFEKGEVFLPQLMKSATASQEGFDIIKKKLAKSGEKSVSKGKIVLATVKGDIHDIGKNIVKVILENYGYQIIDLGRDVDKEEVLKAVKESEASLLGLSALMTTTLKSMEETIRVVNENVPDCKIMVGGAVLTEDYSKEIGADYYVKDSKKSVEVAKKIYS